MDSDRIQQTTPGIRAILYIASALVLSVGISLYGLPERTDLYFSWTINPPLTSAFLGAGYLASFLLELLSARENVWARARPAVPGVWLFTTLTLIVTLVHLDRFHFGSPSFITLAGTWVWLIVYISVPVAMGLAWLLQVRRPGADPPRSDPLPAWMRANLGVQGALMMLAGATMLLSPASMIPIWPWKLSALTARAIGAWGAGIGMIALQAVWENDWGRLRVFLLSYAVYGAMQLINLLRFTDTLDGPDGSVMVYTILLGAVFLTGVYGWMTARRSGLASG